MLFNISDDGERLNKEKWWIIHLKVLGDGVKTWNEESDHETCKWHRVERNEAMNVENLRHIVAEKWSGCFF